MAVLTARDLLKQGASFVKTGEALAPELPPRKVTKVKMRDVPNPEPKEKFVLMHPDCTEDSSMFDCMVTIPIQGEEAIKVAMKRGRIETGDRRVCVYLVSKGYRWMNEPF